MPKSETRIQMVITPLGKYLRVIVSVPFYLYDDRKYYRSTLQV